MNQKRYRAAAIGHTGAGNYGHGLHLAYRRLENVEFIAISDPDPVGREKASMETNALRNYTDYREMLEKEDLDIVSVCPRWVTDHVEMVLACLKSGCHVYCEKPMTENLADGDLIVETAKDRKIGARGLRAIMEKFMLEIMYELPSLPEDLLIPLKLNLASWAAATMPSSRL